MSRRDFDVFFFGTAIILSASKLKNLLSCLHEIESFFNKIHKKNTIYLHISAALWKKVVFR